MPRDFVNEQELAPARGFATPHPPRVETEVVRSLRRAREWLSNPARWAKGIYWGDEFHGNDRPACSINSIKRGGTVETSPTFRAAADLLTRALPPGHAWVGGFNDDPATTHADIMALFDRAISLARQEGR